MKLSKVAQAIYDQAEFLLAQGLGESDALRAAEYTVLGHLSDDTELHICDLSSAFVWGQAPEGHKYWALLNGWK